MKDVPPDRCPERLGLLVGSNPLPNYIAAKMLMPQAVVLIHTTETVKPMERLKAVLQSDGSKVESQEIPDATHAKLIETTCSKLKIDHLHYTGGTKTMAAHALRCFRASDENPDTRASYLDERQAMLRFDDGKDFAFDDKNLGLTLKRILELHDITTKSSNGAEGGPTEKDLDVLAGVVINAKNYHLAQKLLCNFKDRAGDDIEFAKAKTKPVEFARLGVTFSEMTVPGPQWTNKRYKLWQKFMTGGWLEHWVAKRIQGLLAGVDVSTGVKCVREGTTFEIDVSFINKNRLHVISCTTAYRKPLCKGKLFEVFLRARQMGGDLARCALVCLAAADVPPKRENGQSAGATHPEDIRKEAKSVWDAPNVPEVFGYEDLRAWAGVYGEPNLSGLNGWIDGTNEG